ncbi:MAG: autotransporter-associated beta strand repeat-containing protein [Chthoniobacterales bacterium]
MRPGRSPNDSQPPTSRPADLITKKLRITTGFYRRLGLAFITILLFSAYPAWANETWNAAPVNGDWDTAANWTPAVVPGETDDVTFNASSITAITFSADSGVRDAIFNPGASAYTYTASHLSNMTFAVVGITNNSGSTQQFVSQPDEEGNSGAFIFTNSAAAGRQTAFFSKAPTALSGSGGVVEFLDTAAAGYGTYTNEGSALSGAIPGATVFFFNPTADHGAFLNLAATAGGASGGMTIFYSSSKGANATVTNQGATVSGAAGGMTLFTDSSSAGAATLIANGGSNGGGGGLIEFLVHSTGDTSRVEVFGNGTLDVSAHKSMGVGSIEGDGLVLLGTNTLTTGSNGLSTIFSGVIEQQNGTTGSLAKTGVGTLTLGTPSTYTGGTTVSAGTLVVSNKSGSATGTGAVNVSGGTLGGKGIISGAVTVNSGAFLAPAHGTKQQSTLTVQSAFTFNAGSTYTYSFKAKGKQAKTDKVIANGVTVNSGASFNLSGTTKGTLTSGLVLTVISNTSATPISGTFSNLADGAIVTVNGNNLQASYEGGDGNDLTLTVVP